MKSPSSTRRVVTSNPLPSLIRSTMMDPPPLQRITPAGKKHSSAAAAAAADSRKMQIVPSSSTFAGDFELPEGWVVEVRPRPPNSSVKADKYYHDPETGRQFRSLLSIKRYLNGEEEITPKRKSPSAGSFRPLQHGRISLGTVSGGKILEMEGSEEAQKTDLAIIPNIPQHKIASIIPDGWIVEEVPRKDGIRTDRYFIDPIKKLRFRSLPEVQRYLAGQEHRAKPNGLKFLNSTTGRQISDSQKKSTKTRISKSGSDISSPPMRIKWVFNGVREETWSPFVGETVIPDHVKDLWAETFITGMTGRKDTVPLLTNTTTSSE